MPHLCRFRAIAYDASYSPLSGNILEYEFSKTFIVPTFDCYSNQSDPIQHLRQYQDKMVIYSRNNFILC